LRTEAKEKIIQKAVEEEEEIARKKKAKAKSKQDKRVSKEREKTQLKEQQKLSAPISEREIETEKINLKISPLALKIKVIASDGNCLYRAVADQLALFGETELNWPKLRKFAADFMRENSAEFAPFLGLIDDPTEFTGYCKCIITLLLFIFDLFLTFF
jgi:OTU domain-containing protein 6